MICLALRFHSGKVIRPRNMQLPTSLELMKDCAYQQKWRSILWSCFPADVKILMDPIYWRMKLVKKLSSLPTNQDVVVKCLFSKVEAFQSNCYWQNIFAEHVVLVSPGISLPAELNLKKTANKKERKYKKENSHPRLLLLLSKNSNVVDILLLSNHCDVVNVLLHHLQRERVLIFYNRLRIHSHFSAGVLIQLVFRSVKQKKRHAIERKYKKWKYSPTPLQPLRCGQRPPPQPAKWESFLKTFLRIHSQTFLHVNILSWQTSWLSSSGKASSTWVSASWFRQLCYFMFAMKGMKQQLDKVWQRNPPNQRPQLQTNLSFGCLK